LAVSARQLAKAARVLDRLLESRAIYGGHLANDFRSGGISDGEMFVRRDELTIKIKRIDFHDNPDRFAINTVQPKNYNYDSR
jgi:hypothetical protein